MNLLSYILKSVLFLLDQASNIVYNYCAACVLDDRRYNCPHKNQTMFISLPHDQPIATLSILSNSTGPYGIPCIAEAMVLGLELVALLARHHFVATIFTIT